MPAVDRHGVECWCLNRNKCMLFSLFINGTIVQLQLLTNTYKLQMNRGEARKENRRSI
jgi:hypothetical protein